MIKIGFPVGVTDMGNYWFCWYLSGVYRTSFYPGLIPHWIMKRLVKCFATLPLQSEKAHDRPN